MPAQHARPLGHKPNADQPPAWFHWHWRYFTGVPSTCFGQSITGIAEPNPIPTLLGRDIPFCRKSLCQPQTRCWLKFSRGPTHITSNKKAKQPPTFQTTLMSLKMGDQDQVCNFGVWTCMHTLSSALGWAGVSCSHNCLYPHLTWGPATLTPG